VVLFDEWLITFHRYPFCGLSSVMSQVESLRHRALKDEAFCGTMPYKVLALIFEHTLPTSLPDSGELIARAEQIDVSVAGVPIDSNFGTARELLQLISTCRRDIGRQQSQTKRKVHLIESTLTCSLRKSVFVRECEPYAHMKLILSSVSRQLEQNERAREILYQANTNFMSVTGLHHAISKRTMHHRSKLLEAVYVVCLPLAIITGVWGMNVWVPMRVDPPYTTESPFWPFWTLMGVFFTYLIVSLAWLFWYKPFAPKGTKLYDQLED